MDVDVEDEQEIDSTDACLHGSREDSRLVRGKYNFVRSTPFSIPAAAFNPTTTVPFARRPLPSLPPCRSRASSYQVVHIFIAKTSTSVRLQSVLSPPKHPKSSLVKRVRLTPTHIHVERNSRDLDWLLAASRLQPLSLLSPVTTYDLLCLYSKNRGQSPNSNSNRQRPILTDSLLPLPVQPSFPPSSPLLECQLILPPMAQHLIRFNASRFDLL